MLQIIKYNPVHKTILASFMDGLQDYLVSVDYFGTLTRPRGYGIKYVNNLLKEIKAGKGIILFAAEDDCMVGVIAGIIDVLPVGETVGHKKKYKSARVLELYVDPNFRGKKIGFFLMDEIEKYFLKKKCDQIKVEVYIPNKNAHAFYQKQGYQNESIDLIKRL